MRLDELFPFPAERTAFSDEYYAADARNEIVHEIALGIVGDVESTAGRARRLAELQERMRRVAVADLCACLLGQRLEDDERPPQQFAMYAARIVSWVCDVEDAL